jgi:hypothetical protein
MRGHQILNRGFLSVTVFVPIGRGLLEYGNARALRTPLAGLLKFANAFCKPEEEVPPSAANAKEFRAHARPQPSKDSPPCPTSPGFSAKCALSGMPQEGRTNGGRLATVEVEPELETRQHRPPEAGTLSCSLQKAATNVNGPASDVYSAWAFPYSSKPRPIGTKTVTDKNPPFAFAISRCLQPFRLA